MTLKYFEGHFSLCCHFHVHFSNPWHAFASHGLPATAELLVSLILVIFSFRFIFWYFFVLVLAFINEIFTFSLSMIFVFFFVNWNNTGAHQQGCHLALRRPNKSNLAFFDSSWPSSFWFDFLALFWSVWPWKLLFGLTVILWLYLAFSTLSYCSTTIEVTQLPHKPNFRYYTLTHSLTDGYLFNCQSHYPVTWRDMTWLMSVVNVHCQFLKKLYANYASVKVVKSYTGICM